MEFYKYFHPSNKINLENISYEALANNPPFDGEQVKLNCKDTIVAKLTNKGVKINLNRKVDFDPERIFIISVTFSVFLPFKGRTENEMNWKMVDVAGEFRRAGGPVLGALMSRASLMIAQITAASGQNPLITNASPVNYGEKTI